MGEGWHCPPRRSVTSYLAGAPRALDVTRKGNEPTAQKLDVYENVAAQDALGRPRRAGKRRSITDSTAAAHQKCLRQKHSHQMGLRPICRSSIDEREGSLHQGDLIEVFNSAKVRRCVLRVALVDEHTHTANIALLREGDI